MNRRRFIHQLMLGMAAPLGQLNQLVLADNASLKTSGINRRLILVELAGANDGLNTLVPFSNDHYHTLRPTIRLNQSAVQPISEEHGMHTALKPLMNEWQSGELAWIQGLGYPAANRSHFASIALWETAGDGLNSRGDRGWMTHAIEHLLRRPVLDPHGISMAGDLDLFASATGRWLSIGSTAQLSTRNLPAQEAQRIRATQGQGQVEPRHQARALVQQQLQTLDATLTRLQEKVQSVPEVPTFQGGHLGEQLRHVAQLITAGVDTPVFRVRIEGFDTHQNQLGQHTRLLTELAVSLHGFASTLKRLGEWNNTIVMTYSEFGRRAAENRSGGTDHGTAAPHMVMGGDVNGGFYSTAPDLGHLPDGDPVHTMDYRALYRTLLVDALGVTADLPHLSQFADPRLSTLLKRT